MSRKCILGLLACVLGQVSLVTAQGLNDEQMTILSRNLFNRADADKNGQLNGGEAAQAQALVMAQIELVARRALADPSLRIGQVLNEATLPGVPQSDNIGEAEFRQHVTSMFVAADRPVRALYEQRLERLLQLQAEMRRAQELRDGPIMRDQDYRNWNDGRELDQREREILAREREARGQDGTPNQEQQRAQATEQQRREAAARAAQREMQIRAEQQLQQQAKPVAQPKPQPFQNKLQPGQGTAKPFSNKLQGK